MSDKFMDHCDHGSVGGDQCIVAYDSEECPMCALQEKQRQEDEVHRVELSFTELEDGTCNVFADIFSFNGILQLTAEQAHFVSAKLFSRDDNKNILLNVPYETLKAFAASILRKEK